MIVWPRPPGAARYVMDITFGTDGWRDVIAAGFTFANVRRAAAAYADHLLARGGGLVLLGYDTRFLGREFAEQAAAVLAERGLEARVSVDYLPTPALSFAVKRYGAAGGVMITASHNPPRYGGFKLKGPYGGTATQAIYADVAARVPAGPVPEGRGAFGAFDVREEYYDALAALVDVEALRAAAPRVVHDAIGGAGAGWLAGFAARTGALEVIEVRGRPDPLFHGVNPEPIPANVVSTAELMAEAHDRAGAPLFAAVTDGDGDRLGVVLPGGSFFDAHQVFAVMLDHLERRGGRGRVVKTFTVSRVIERLARSRGLAVQETPVGFKHVVDAMLEPGEPVLIGGEESGGIGLAAHLPERDGLANALVLLEAAVASGETLAEAFGRLERETGWRHAYDRLDLHLNGAEAMAAVRARLADPPSAFGTWRVAGTEGLDGLKLNLEKGGEVAAWVLFRASGTEPLLRVYCEAPTGEDVAEVLAAARRLVGT